MVVGEKMLRTPAMLVLALGLVSAAPAQVTGMDTVQASGPSRNRVDLVFFGDGWVESEASAMQAELDSHIQSFFRIPDYARYRKFFNIYRARHFRVKPAGSLQTKTNFQYYVDAILKALPEAEPKYIVSKNGNSGEGGNVGLASARLSLTSNTYQDEIGVHEMGHGWHRLGDIYAGGGGESWPNATADPTGRKWSHWLGYVEPFTKLKVGAYPIEDSRFYRPTDTHCSIMSDVYCGKPLVYDPVGREKMIWDIYDLVDPLDGWTPNASVLVNPGEIKVAVVDPAVIKVDWYLDGRLVEKATTGTFLAPKHITRPGTYAIKAHAYDFILTKAYSDRGGDSLGTPGSAPPDSLDWVRRRLDRLQQEVVWQATFNTVAGIARRDGDGLPGWVTALTPDHIDLSLPGAGDYAVEALSLDGIRKEVLTAGHAGGAGPIRIAWRGRRYSGVHLLRISHAGETRYLKWIPGPKERPSMRRPEAIQP